MQTLTDVLERKPSFCAILMKKLEVYFQDAEHRKRFEEWYRKKYGKEYEWR